jgi:hypothetical protein
MPPCLQAALRHLARRSPRRTRTSSPTVTLKCIHGERSRCGRNTESVVLVFNSIRLSRQQPRAIIGGHLDDVF